MIDFFTEAIKSLRPGAAWGQVGDTYEGLQWFDTIQSKPSIQEIEQEIQRLQQEYDNKLYQRLRQPEYPPITDYLDGVVKGDQQQIAAYIAACQAVKAKYPKPE